MSDVKSIPEGWAETTLGKVGKVITGKTPSKDNPKDWGDLIDFITPTDIKSDNKYISNCPRKLSISGVERFSKMILPEKSVIVTCIGSDMGKVVLNKNKALANQQINSIIVNEKNCCDFIYYLLKNSYKILRKKAEGSGSTMPILNKSTFENLEFYIPKNTLEQKSIAEILTSFDDKIELLQAQNKILEETAQTIFKEWFGKYKNGDELPEGWQIDSLEKIANHSKTSIKPFDNPDTAYYHYSLPSYDNGLIPVIEKGEMIKSNKYLVENNSFLVSKLNPFTPRIWTVFDAQQNFICSTEFQVVKPKEELYFSLIHCFLNSDEFTSELSQKIKGTSSSHQRVNPQDIFDVELVIPSENDLINFNSAIYPLLAKKNINHKQIQTLSQTRDELLPRLMSGEIRVNEFKV
nr:restriction endonuclease subunit S [uncultured Flavobacterium sp.]